MRAQIIIDVNRLEFFSSCVNFSRKQRISLQNLRRNMKFTQSFGKFILTCSLKLLKFYIFMIISTKKAPNLFILKVTLLYRWQKQSRFTSFLVCKSFGPKIRSCKILTNFKSGCKLQIPGPQTSSLLRATPP